MNSRDDCSSGYCSDETIENKDEADLGKLPDCNFERIIFTKNDEERPPFHWNCCCHNSSIDRSLTLVLLHYFILFTVITFSIIFLLVAQTDSKFTSGVLALLSTCLGNVLPGPRG